MLFHLPWSLPDRPCPVLRSGLQACLEKHTVRTVTGRASHDDTTAEVDRIEPSAHPPQPGVAVVFSVDRPALRVLGVGETPVRIGRGLDAHVVLDDATTSRLHAEVSIQRGHWVIRNHGRHGTFVDGQKVDDLGTFARARTLRVGDTLLALVSNVGPFVGREVSLDGDMVIGPTMQRVHAELVRAATEGIDVLVSGESGVGKEYAARRYHEARSTPGGPLVAVNCATISAALFEAELFGHARGAFSGAERDRVGLFEAAHGGTLFLDEIGEIPLELQAKLLRVLQERSFRRVGESRERPVDVRVVGATNRPVPLGAAPPWLRPDLFYRLAGGVVRLPPLRDRWEEIPTMIQRELARTGQVPSVGLVERCMLNDWPGNARELLAAVRHAAVAARDHELLHRKPAAAVGGQWLPYRMPEVAPDSGTDPTRVDGGRLTREAVVVALANHGGNVSAAAEALGVHRNTLHRHMKKWGME